MACVKFAPRRAIRWIWGATSVPIKMTSVETNHSVLKETTIKTYISAGPSIEGPPGCEAFAISCILYPMYPFMYPVSYILCILVSLHLHPFIPVSCMLQVVSCILDSAIWMLECGPRITRITTHWAVSWNPVTSLYS